ncbi:hypothetical protein BDZ97DRAFT_243732 [Flammula alnicola]|nr:hypothetical protein BDZ97DRAFT_243732 [Flammula alnicola]
MLGSRTKQINAYGKRGRRVVDATTDDNPSITSTEIISIFDDLPPAPEWKSVASKMKKRENTVPTKSNVASVKVVGLQRKKRLSPVISPPKKKKTTRVAQLVAAEVHKPTIPAPTILKAKPKILASGKPEDPIILSASPPRAPLSSVALNIPGSPAITQNLRLAPGKGTPVRSNKPFSPFVDVDIIVLDDEGRTLRTERRVSRTDVDANPFNKRSKPAKKHVAPPEDTDIEYEAVSQPRRPQRHTARKPIIISDDSESEEDSTPPKPPKAPPKGTQAISKSSISSSRTSHTSSNSVIDVLIPPARYKIPRLISAPAPAAQARSSSPPPEIQQVPLPNVPQLARQPAPARCQHIPSPTQKPRQLTPIRGGRKRLFEPPSPPSPTTPTDFDLSIDFSDLNLGSASQTQGKYQSGFETPDSLIPLLQECHQEECGPHNFSTFIESFPYDPILESAREDDAMDMRFRKIGEASYSEVFGIGDVVLKVIPLRDESRTEAYQEEDGPAPSDAKDVRKEIIVTRAIGEVYDGFVRLLKTYVVRGRYPEVLLQLWDEYNERKGSESVRPDTFKVSQVYAIIVLPNGGPDLEAYTFHNASRTGWRQACSIFWQVAKALAHAEHLVSFEHRDLHWGQILVKNVPINANALKALNLNQKIKPKAHRVWMDDASHGVQATVIDLGLSRMDAGDGGDGDLVHWTPFDQEVFMGEGDYQFDVYRIMKDLTGGAWEEFHPITNWLHYLLQKLLYSKGIKPPPAPRRMKGTSETPLPPSSAEASFSQKDCYDCLLDIDGWLGKAIAELAPENTKTTLKGKGRRKTQAPAKAAASSGPARAGEIVAYGVKKGWIKPTLLS